VPELNFLFSTARVINKVPQRCVLEGAIPHPSPLPIPWELPYSIDNYCNCQTWESGKHDQSKNGEVRISALTYLLFSPCIHGIPEGRKVPYLTSLFSGQVTPPQNTLDHQRMTGWKKPFGFPVMIVTGVVGLVFDRGVGARAR